MCSPSLDVFSQNVLYLEAEVSIEETLFRDSRAKSVPFNVGSVTFKNLRSYELRLTAGQNHQQGQSARRQETLHL